MNPESLVTQQVLDFCRQSKTTVILGKTKSGKVTIARKIAQELNIPLFKSDDYINEQDRVNSLYTLMDAVLPYYNQKTSFVVEGILCYRMLRKGIQLGNFYPDLIIKTNCNDATIKHFYIKDGEGDKLNHALGFNKGLDKIWNEYLDMLFDNPLLKKPTYIELETSLPELK